MWIRCSPEQNLSYILNVDILLIYIEHIETSSMLAASEELRAAYLDNSLVFRLVHVKKQSFHIDNKS